MAEAKLPSDERMRAWRLAGRFVCQCRDPVRRPVGVFGGWECRRCWHPIIDQLQAQQLIESVLAEVDL